MQRLKISGRLWIGVLLLSALFIALFLTFSAPPAVHAQDPDRDGDGIPDGSDNCPDEPGTPENNGCGQQSAIPDSDGDGLTDDVDSCPATFAQTSNGCPGSPDSDGDGLTDDVDGCPTTFGQTYNNGCPLPDSDNDTVPDGGDYCPNEPGNALSQSGCPDRDFDGWADMDDMCPDESSGFYDGWWIDTRGCPEGPSAVVDSDGDGFNDDEDICPYEFGDVLGCLDSDGDNWFDFEDWCPYEEGTLQGCPDEDADSFIDINGDDWCPALYGEVNGCPSDVPDTDGDTWNDNDDFCPNDWAGPNSQDGCPLGDSDEDGLGDDTDVCPYEPAGPLSLDGCPYADFDGDGFTDDWDYCPEEPGEDLGCPFLVEDTDGDGVLDIDDYCPEEPGTDHGCSDADFDGDAVADFFDYCPEQPGLPEDNGCPMLSVDTDEDGWVDEYDDCPSEYGWNFGCPLAIADSDEDGWTDDIDACPDLYAPEWGCPIYDGDYDQDGVADLFDVCPFDGDYGAGVDEDGCPVGVGFEDTDEDGILDIYDACPLDYGWWDSNVAYGCPDDSDWDGLYDPYDACPLLSDNYMSFDGCPVAIPPAAPVRQATARPQAPQVPTNRPTTPRPPITATGTGANVPPKVHGNLNTRGATACQANAAGFSAPRLVVGQAGRSANPTQRLNLRKDAGTTGRLIGTVDANVTFVVISGPLCSAENGKNLTWWYVYANGQGGWVAESENAQYLVNPLALPANLTLQIIQLQADATGKIYTASTPPANVGAKTIFTASVISLGQTRVELLGGTGAALQSGTTLEPFIVATAGQYSVVGQSNQPGILIVLAEIKVGGGGQTTPSGTAPAVVDYATLNRTQSGSCSVDSNREVQFTFTNTLDIPVEIFWVDYNCAEVSYGIVPAHDRVPMITYETHPWLVRDQQGNFIGEYIITSQYPTLIIDSGSQVTSGGVGVEQWAVSAMGTSQFSPTDYSFAQATGEPNTGVCADMGTAWASSTGTGPASLTLVFAQAVIPSRVEIYETFTPGSIIYIEVINSLDGSIMTIPNSADPPGNTACPGVFSVDLTLVTFPIDIVIIYLDETIGGNWNEIDAVKLVGTN